MRPTPTIVLALIAAIATSWLGLSAPSSEVGAEPPSGFRQTTVYSDLTFPVAVEFAPDGRVFIAERDGRVLVADAMGDRLRPIINIRTRVHVDGDRGMLGLAHRQARGREWIYVSYMFDAPPGETSPTWGHDDPAVRGWEGCPEAGQCIAQGRISRFELIDGAARGEQVLVQGWCSQFSNHGLGDLHFAADGSLYASAGDLAWAHALDIGDRGTPLNGCGSPPGRVGDQLSAPTAQGGSLVSQDLRTGNDPLDLAGTIIRIDPDTGRGLPDNPLFGNADPNEQRLVAYGFRNPYRFTIHPQTGEVYIGDVGATSWEEINVLSDPLGMPIENFGWPCYEGHDRQRGFDLLDVDVCESLYVEGRGAVFAPWLTYHHDDDPVAPGECAARGGAGAITGVDFYEAGGYPAEYEGALFVAEYGDRCIFVVKPRPDGSLDPTAREVFISPVDGVVDITTAPDGDIILTTIGGEVSRVSYVGGEDPPVAVVTADPQFGATPLTVDFDASASTGGTGRLSYAWDLDGDGDHDDAAGASARRRYTTAGRRVISVRVTDARGLTDEATVSIDVGNTPPEVDILRPSRSDEFSVGDRVQLRAVAVDEQDGELNAASIDWTVFIEHCPTPGDCHTHPQGNIEGRAAATIDYPDHEGPFDLVVRATATDSSGETSTVETVAASHVAPALFDTSPTGLNLVIAGVEHTAPRLHEPPEGSTVSVSAPARQRIGSTAYLFDRWSDGNTDRNRDLAATPELTDLTAKYELVPVAERGYLLLDASGEVTPFGPARHHGNARATPGVDAVDIAVTADGGGYLVAFSDGTIVPFGNAPTPTTTSEDVDDDELVVALALTEDDRGYWLFTDRGRVMTSGKARHHGDAASISLDAPMTAASITPGGNGYRLLGRDGGVFNFGDARFLGSVPQVLPGVDLDCPIVGLVSSLDGYWLVGCDGGVFAFGDAPFVGSLPAIDVVPRSPVEAMVPHGDGYLLIARDGGVFAFGGVFLGSLGNSVLDTPIVAVAIG